MSRRTHAGGVILCATDLTPAGDAALRRAAELARVRKVRLVALHVLPDPLRHHPLLPLARNLRYARLPEMHARATANLQAQVERVIGVAFARRHRAPLSLLHVVDLRPLMVQPDFGVAAAVPLTEALRESLLASARTRLGKALRRYRDHGRNRADTHDPRERRRNGRAPRAVLHAGRPIARIVEATTSLTG